MSKDKHYTISKCGRYLEGGDNEGMEVSFAVTLLNQMIDQEDDLQKEIVQKDIKLALGKFYIRRLLHIAENSKWIGNHHPDDFETGYQSTEDYLHDKNSDMIEAEKWIKDIPTNRLDKRLEQGTELIIDFIKTITWEHGVTKSQSNAMDKLINWQENK